MRLLRQASACYYYCLLTQMESDTSSISDRTDAAEIVEGLSGGPSCQLASRPPQRTPVRHLRIVTLRRLS